MNHFYLLFLFSVFFLLVIWCSFRFRSFKFTKPDRADLVKPDEIYRDGYHQTPLKEYYEQLSAKYYFNKAGLSKYAALKRNITKKVLEHIRYLIKDQRNMISYCFAEPGDGKSRLIQWLARKVREFTREQCPDLKANIHYSKNMDISAKLFPLIEEGDIVIQDEDPNIHGLGTKTMMDSMDTLLQQLRKTRKSIIFISPNLHIYTGVYVAFEIFGKNTDLFRTKVLVHYYDRTGEGSQVTHAVLGYMKVDLSSDVDAEIYANYLKAVKDPNLQSIQLTGGAVMATSNIDMIESLVPEFMASALSHGWNGNSKVALRITYLEFFVKERERAGRAIALVSKDPERLAELTYAAYQREHGKQKQETELKTRMVYNGNEERFTVDREAILAEISKSPPKGITPAHWIEYIDQYRRLDIHREKVDVIANELNIGSGGTVSKHAERVRGAFYLATGHLYEQFVGDRLLASKRYDTVTVDGSENGPDVWATRGKSLFIWSCKCFDFIRSSKSVDGAEVKQEIKFAREQQAATGKWDSIITYFQWINLQEGIDHEVPFDYLNSPPTFVLNYVPPEEPKSNPPQFSLPEGLDRFTKQVLDLQYMKEICTDPSRSKSSLLIEAVNDLIKEAYKRGDIEECKRLARKQFTLSDAEKVHAALKWPLVVESILAMMLAISETKNV